MKQDKLFVVTSSWATPPWRFSRSLLAAALTVSIAFGIVSSFAAFAADDVAARRASAKEQFARAEALRADLEAKPERQRSLQDYAKVVSAYRRVMLITPHAPEVPQAIEQAGDIYRRMGQQFGREYFDSALEMYQFLRREYPAAHSSEDALLAIAAMHGDDLAEPAQAKKSYQDFLKQYPHSAHAVDARKALAELAAAKSTPAGKTASAKAPVQVPVSDAAASDPVPGTVQKVALNPKPSHAKDDSNDGAAGEPSEVSSVRVWNADTYTRIVIDLGGQAKYQAARISDPDRIYFDIEGAQLSPPLLHHPIPVPSGGYLKSVRVAQNRADTVRVVLDVTKVKDYSVFELADPDRLVVDVYGPSAQLTKITSVPVKSADAVETTTPVPAPAVDAPATASSAVRVPASGATGSASSPAARLSASAGAAKGRAKTSAAAAAMGPAPIPEKTRAGERSLTRALGLKVGRIVIDAGHGGHDTGTIGPTGLMEKDLCLDVALRLGKLIQQRIPSAQVTYTRDDDSFVPLEQRTAIANEAKADLFLSIHANSSSDHHVSGIETYYLNFNASPGAMEVAARENAVGQSSVHDLQDLVSKIARNEKIEESRDFATDIQESLAKRVDRAGAAERDRGVRKAPFVVLIGADMPSVLAEISFLSNPADEQWLKKPENRQRVAEGLYHGIENYLHSTNSLASSTPLSASSAQ